MKKFCSNFLVFERNYWNFGLNFLSNLSKLPPMGAAKVLIFFGEKSNCLVIFGIWAKVTNFWQKNFWQVAKSAFYVFSAKLWEKMVKVIYTNDIFFRTLSEFFLILAKKISQVCRNSNLSVHRKNVKKNTLEQLVFRLFLNFDKKTCVFTGKFLAMLSKLLSTCPEENLQGNISQRKFRKLQDFRIIFEVFGTMAEKIFRVGNTAKHVQGNSLWKKFFKSWKIGFFSDPERFSTSSGNFR